ncbi:MAG: RNA polymerase sigma factor [Sedimentisphaerales bacterium]|nr:RNA polymerase sigma factor [Sedimentisphaerales bacterium]
MTADAGKTQSVGWLDRLLGGDQAVFAQFVDRYKDTVFLCCRTLGLKEDEAEDVASETFLAAYKGLSRYKGQAQLHTWLWAIAYRQAVSYLRKNKRASQLSDELQEQASTSKEQTPPAAAQSNEYEKIVWDAVGKLPRIWAVMVILHYREEKMISEIAKIMRIRENTAKTYLFRARNKLKETLAPVFGEGFDVD